MKIVLPVIIGISLSLYASAQTDLLKQLQTDSTLQNEKVIATFKGIRIINLNSVETVKKRNLDFRVTHLFGNMGKESGGGFHNLYGFDQSNDIRIAFYYGITDRLNVGVSRLKRNENLEGEIKYKLLEQSVDNKMPLTLALFGNVTYTPKEDPSIEKAVHRMTYIGQVILAHKFSNHFSLELVSSYLHRNLVPSDDENDLFSIGGAARWKFTKSTSLIADYMVTPGRSAEIFPERYDPLGVGFEIETGGHVFTLMFTNASGILENDYIPNTTDSWDQGGFKFSFHISRMFTLGKK